MVTLTTVGYGDVVPVTFLGRLVGVALMVVGVLSLSLVTATVASVFIERKFRQEKGLEAVKATQHILILGWPEDAEALLDQLLKRLPPDHPGGPDQQSPAGADGRHQRKISPTGGFSISGGTIPGKISS